MLAPRHGETYHPGVMTIGKYLRSINEHFIRKGAERISRADVERLAHMVGEVRHKLVRFGPLKPSLVDLTLLLALIRDFCSGRYRTIPWWAVSSIAFALLYVLNPFDLIPDFIPVLGQIDDILVISICLSLVGHELKLYRAWKDTRQTDPPPTNSEPCSPAAG
jgi:uncharacterized membrane protein YkvA (DUF1232 family)